MREYTLDLRHDVNEKVKLPYIHLFESQYKSLISSTEIKYCDDSKIYLSFYLKALCTKIHICIFDRYKKELDNSNLLSLLSIKKDLLTIKNSKKIKRFILRNKQNKSNINAEIIDETDDYFITKNKAYLKELNEKIVVSDSILDDMPEVRYISDGDYYVYRGKRVFACNIDGILSIINNIEELVETLFNDYK